MQFHEGDVDEQEIPEKNEAEKKGRASHFEDAYHLKANENYEANQYRYQTDNYGRISRCEGTLRLGEGKRNLDHQRRAGGEDRREPDGSTRVEYHRFKNEGGD